MSTRERILTIRLLEKVEKYPLSAEALGVQVAVCGADATPMPIEPESAEVRL